MNTLHGHERVKSREAGESLRMVFVHQRTLKVYDDSDTENERI